MTEFIEFEKLSMKGRKDITEAMIQDLIAENPKILGLGDLILKDKERTQNGAGRLDILLQDIDSGKRYEVEIQLGKLDESHIIRTIEYWDIEKRRYPQFEHCAVIIAEDITSRFLNIIQLFNGHIPLIAIQMNAYEVDGKKGLIFTKVIDEIALGVEEEESAYESASREYWENRSSIETMKIVDYIYDIIQIGRPDIEIKYNKPYIGLTEKGIANNFIIFVAKKKHIRMEIRMDRSDELDNLFESSDLDFMGYNASQKRYKVRLSSSDINNNRELFEDIIERSYIV